MSQLKTYRKSDIEYRLKKLTGVQRIAFGVCCCERLLPNYIKFKKDVNWGNEKPIKNAIERIWSYLLGINTLKKTDLLIQECESAAPDSEDFQSEYTSFAQDSVFAVCSVLDYFEQKNVERIAQAASYAIDTIDLHVQEIENMLPNDPNLEERISSHPLMQAEITNQYNDLQFLEDGGNIADLKIKWHSQLLSNIGI